MDITNKIIFTSNRRLQNKFDQIIINDLHEKKLDIQEFNMMIDMIDKLYYEIIIPFQEGLTSVHNPNIFAFMTKNDFVEWIKEYNSIVREIFDRQF